MRKAIVTQEFCYNSAKKESEYISEIIKNDDRKIYEYLDIQSEKPREQIPIHRNRKCHMISYFPSVEKQKKGSYAHA